MTVAIKVKENGLMSESGMKLLRKRYLDGPEDSVNAMFRRVSLGNPVYEEMLTKLLMLPNSPTLFNAGKNNGCTSSACFTFTIGDYMLEHEGKVMNDSIVRTREKAVSVAKAGGGVGYYGGFLRPRNSPIKSVHRRACGPVGVLHDYQGVSDLITQGGKRELAQMFVLPVGHDDIEEFIDVKGTPDKASLLSSFNISVSWDDASLKGAFHPTSTDNPVFVNDKYRELWNKQCQAAWATGCPGMYFHDSVNRRNMNKHLGLFWNPNPCGEAYGRTDEACNLLSLVASRFVDLKTRKFNLDYWAHCARIGNAFLDDILTQNVFPHPDITEAVFKTRRLGMGIMGWADTLALMGLKYGSPAARVLADQVWSVAMEAANLESVHRGAKYGPYPAFDETLTEGPKRRNESLGSIAPNGSIGPIADAWGGIEPYYSLGEVERTTAEGMKLAGGMPDWIRENLDGFVPDTADDISVEDHVRMQAAFQKHTCLGVSKTINMPTNATVGDVSKAYKLMYDLKCMGGTIFRKNCRPDQVLREKPTSKKNVYMNDVNNAVIEAEMNTATTIAGNRVQEIVASIEAEVISSGLQRFNEVRMPGMQIEVNGSCRRRLPKTRDSKTHKFQIGDAEGYLTVGLYEDGTPGEFFIRFSKVGSTVAGLLDGWAMTFSTALQYGAPLKSLCRLLMGHRFEPAGLTDDPTIKVASSIMDYVARWLEYTFLKSLPSQPAVEPDIGSGIFCPDCSSEVIFQSGCLMCVKDGCNWSRCG